MHSVFLQACVWYPFFMGFKITYVDSGTAKVPTSAKFGPRVKILTSEICNLSLSLLKSPPFLSQLQHFVLILL